MTLSYPPTSTELTDQLRYKTPYQVAQYIVARLQGYRQTSLKRADDLDGLTRALEVFSALQRREGRL